MKTITETISIELQKMKDRGWEHIYLLVDIHDTIFKACYRDHEKCEWLGRSREALAALSKDPRFVIILWSSTHPGRLDNYVEVLKSVGIQVTYVNSNPEVRTDDLGCFDRKPYFNVILDDKSGFEPSDWEEILKFLEDEDI